ncbi:amino acid permease [Ornithinimicrobium ciconiae]|uniref:Amino acid permease n=1 Tax=Ornithinimicrobium ciconiae TaxID=2594265 RepID=A0A516GFR5_9MICO|nr:amino acid permease [Ornithinimicrobium ciconiae]
MTRRLSLHDAVGIGLGSMIGAGVFVVWAPAAQAAGSWLLLSLAVAAVVAVCNAWSSAALAVRYPSAGGTYVYGRERLGSFAGYLAGWSFVVGKIASCAAMAMAIAAYVAPGRERVAAVVAVVVVTALNLTGVQRSARVSRVISSVVIAVLAGVMVAGLVGGETGAQGASGELFTDAFSAYGVLQGAGLIFFAFAGYARIATLAEEVEAPERTIPLAVAITVTAVLTLYAFVAVLTLVVLGPEQLAQLPDPVAAATDAVLSAPWVWAVRTAAALAAFGALLNLVLGVSRTSLAMARDGHLPAPVARVSARGVPHHAELAVGAIVLLLVLVVDLRGAIGFSSFGVLTYYAVANASAWTLGGDWRWARTVPVLGLLGCLVLASTLPWPSVLGGVVVLGIGILLYAVTRDRRARART